MHILRQFFTEFETITLWPCQVCV